MTCRGSSVCFVLVAIATMIAGGCSGADDQSAARVELIFGCTGLGPGEFSYPRAAEVDGAGRVYVVDKSARIQRFSPDGKFQLDWAMPASTAGKPTGFGIGADGRVFVADTHYSRVLVYSPDGELLHTYGTRGSAPGQFLLPTDVAVFADGKIYVGEYGGNDRISRFNSDWEFEISFGDADGPEQARLRRPQSLLAGPDGTLWVADACNHRVCQFSADGELLCTFGQSGSEAGELRFPYGLAWLRDGTLIVAEYGSNRVQRFSTAGKSLGTWGTAGREAGHLAYPWDVAVGTSGQIYIVDSGNNRVQVLGPAGQSHW